MSNKVNAAAYGVMAVGAWLLGFGTLTALGMPTGLASLWPVVPFAVHRIWAWRYRKHTGVDRAWHISTADDDLDTELQKLLAEPRHRW